ncbi:MAG: FimB/Mfa2 family fimbrial subunit, partial [Alistipes sp.]|nr:FimB/Mfa2 family fimbrial subunit [Alistipes sp.]
MKNIFRIVMAVAILFTASCAKEDISSTIGGGEVEVTFTANLAGIGTRAIADGTTVDRVYVAIFDATSKTHLSELTLPEGYPVSNGQASMTVVLLRDKKYDLVFWAQKDGTGAYTLDLAHRKVKANYGAEANNEARDAFFRIDNNWVAGVGSTTFELRRPFAQINAGNSDADVKYVDANGSVITKSSMTVITEIYDTLDLTDGSLTGNEVSAEFTLAAIPSQTIAGTVDPTHDATLNASAEYNYLAMNYLLVNDRQLVDLVFNYTDGTTTFERKYFQVPVQRNYRTNILGQLISSPYEFEVVIDSDFEKDEQGNLLPDHTIIIAG